MDRIHSFICFSLHHVLKDPSSTVVQGPLVKNPEALWVLVWGRMFLTLHSAPLASPPALTSGNAVPNFLPCQGRLSWLYLWSFSVHVKFLGSAHQFSYTGRFDCNSSESVGQLKGSWHFVIPSLLPWVSPAPSVYWGAHSCFSAVFCSVWCEGRALLWVCIPGHLVSCEAVVNGISSNVHFFYLSVAALVCSFTVSN